MTDASGTSGPDHAAPGPEGPASPYGPPPPAAAPGVPSAGPAPYAELPYGHTPYHQNPYGAPTYGMPGYGAPLRDPDARPGTVLAAGVVTLVLSGLVLMLLLVFTAFLLAARGDFLDGFSDTSGFGTGDADAWFVVVLVVLLGFIVWCVAAIVLAILALRRSNPARIALVVSSAVTALLSLLAIAGGVSVITLAASVAVIVLLFTGGATEWYRREHLYSPPSPPPV